MNFVCLVFELGDKTLTLSPMENLMVKCNLLIQTTAPETTDTTGIQKSVQASVQALRPKTGPRHTHYLIKDCVDGVPEYYLLTYKDTPEYNHYKQIWQLGEKTPPEATKTGSTSVPRATSYCYDHQKPCLDRRQHLPLPPDPRNFIAKPLANVRDRCSHGLQCPYLFEHVQLQN